MPTLPRELASIILAFCPLFSGRVWKCAHVLLIGAILAPGKRTVTSALRIMGLGDEQHFQNYHRVLNRAAWNCRRAGLILLRLLLDTFAPRGPLVLGLDDTIERRWGGKIQARGIYRDPVRSSHSHFVKTSGLRWLSLCSWSKFPGQDVFGLCPSSLYWLLLCTITKSENSVIRHWWIGAGRCSFNSGAGSRNAPSFWL